MYDNSTIGNAHLLSVQLIILHGGVTPYFSWLITLHRGVANWVDYFHGQLFCMEEFLACCTIMYVDYTFYVLEI